jgi:ribosome biogenesis protein MAK21
MKGSQKAGTTAVSSATNVDYKTQDPRQLQTLNTQAFSDLSQKIQALSTKLEHDPKKNRKKPPKRDNNIHPSTASRPRAESTSVKGHTRGKKRDSQGVVIEEGKQKTFEKQAKTASKHSGVLEKELYALGGTAEDLALVADLDSESELEDGGDLDNAARETKFKKGLRKGAAAIVKQIEEHGRLSPMGYDTEDEGDLDKDDEDEKTGNESSYATPSTGDAVDSKSSSGKSHLLIAPCSDWFNIELPAIKNSDVSNTKVSHDHVKQLYEQAKSLLDKENEAFKASQQSSSSQNFYSTVIASGTLSDKISALTLAVQESPLHNVKALENLVNLGKKHSRAQAVDVLRALKDLFAQGSLLPSDRKLHAFTAHPSLLGALARSSSWKPGDALPTSLQPKHLIVWAYESWLKEKYFETLKTLEVWCNDEIEFSKAKAVNFVYELLKEKPEQESNLLRLLTNKLGDPSKKIASQTSYLLMQLMAAHPLMKMTIISSVESDLLFRPGQSLHAKYYAVITLNQTTLSGKEEEVASKLLDIYFSLFVGLLKPAEGDKRNSNDRPRRKDAKRSHGKSYKSQINDSENAQAEDLREKLTSAILTGINRAYPYTGSSNQRYVTDILRIVSLFDICYSLPTHLESLFKITHSSNFNTSIQAMMLIQQLCSSHQASVDRFYRTLYESLLDARLITSSKHSLYLNLLYKALKADINVKRVKAFVKRILQVLALHQPSFICSCFFLLQELRQTFPSLSALIDQPEEHDLDEEVYEDVRDPEDGTAAPRKADTSSGRLHTYDSRKRDAEHSHAENSCLWEVIPFQAHFHPSVSVSAEHLIRHAKLPGKPDLELHTLIHFLDRFVYRNAKIGTSNLRGSSIMQPLAGGDAAGLLVTSGSHVQLPVNSDKFWARKGEDVPAEDAFFHQYFTSLGKTAENKKSRNSKHEGDNDAIKDEESEIWKAMMESAPDLEGADNSDEDLEMSDLESAFEESLDEAAEEGEEEGEEVAALLAEDSSSDLDMSPAEGSAHSVSGEDELAPNPPKQVRERGSTRRRRLKNLPTFASASDYAKMIDEEEGEDVGSFT